MRLSSLYSPRHENPSRSQWCFYQLGIHSSRTHYYHAVTPIVIAVLNDKPLWRQKCYFQMYKTKKFFVVLPPWCRVFHNFGALSSSLIYFCHWRIPCSPLFYSFLAGQRTIWPVTGKASIWTWVEIFLPLYTITGSMGVQNWLCCGAFWIVQPKAIRGTVCWFKCRMLPVSTVSWIAWVSPCRRCGTLFILVSTSKNDCPQQVLCR